MWINSTDFHDQTFNNCVVQVFSLRTSCRTKCMPQQEFMMFQIAFGIFFLFIHNFYFTEIHAIQVNWNYARSLYLTSWFIYNASLRFQFIGQRFCVIEVFKTVRFSLPRMQFYYIALSCHGALADVQWNEQ